MSQGITFPLLCELMKVKYDISINESVGNKELKFHTARLFNRQDIEPGILYIQDKGSACLMLAEGITNVSVDSDCVTLYNAAISVFEEISEWDNRMQKASWMPNAISQIIAIAADQIPHPMYVADPGYRIYAMSDHPDMSQMSYSWKYSMDQGYLPLDIMLNLYESEELRKSKYTNQACITTSDYFYTRFTNYVIKMDKTVYGHFFVIEIFKAFKDYEIELIQMIGDAIRKALTQNTQFSSTSGSLYEHFVIDVLEGTLTNVNTINIQLNALRLTETWKFGVLRIESFEHDMVQLRSVCNVVETKVKNTLTVLHKQGVTIVVHLPNKNALEVFEKEMNIFLQAAKLTSGMSDLFESFLQLPIGYNQAVAAIDSVVDKTSSQIVRFSDVAFAHFVSENLKNISQAEYLHPGLVQILEYDTNNETQLMCTLQCFLENDRVAGDTAEQLFIHRNTLMKRLDKIQALGDIDLADYATVKRLILSFEIMNASSED